MEVSLAVLADYANISREGKLNVMGIFDRVMVRQLPGRLPPTHLVIRLDAGAAEMDVEHGIRVQLTGPDGEALFHIDGAFTPRGAEPGLAVSVNHIINIGNLPIQKEGGHRVVVWVDGELKREVPLQVTKVPEPPPAPRPPGAEGPTLH